MGVNKLTSEKTSGNEFNKFAEKLTFAKKKNQNGFPEDVEHGDKNKGNKYTN